MERYRRGLKLNFAFFSSDSKRLVASRPTLVGVSFTGWTTYFGNRLFSCISVFYQEVTNDRKRVTSFFIFLRLTPTLYNHSMLLLLSKWEGPKYHRSCFAHS